MRPGFGLLVLFAMGIGATVVGCTDDASPGSAPANPDASINAGDSATNGDAGDGGVIDDGRGLCAPTTGEGTKHEGGIGTETWTAAASPHIIVNDVSVNGTLTLEPCAEVLFVQTRSLGIVAGSKLVAESEPRRHIRMAAQDPQKHFAQLYVNGGGTLSMKYVDIENGGDPQNTILDVTGTIRAQADQTLPTQPIILADHVTIKGSMSNGLYLETGAGFAPGSTDLVVTGSANYAMSISSRAVDTVPSGNYTGNAKNEIVLPAGGGTNSIQEDSTIRNRGVPYRIGDSLSFGYLTVEKLSPGPGVVTLTIEPGVTLRFKKDAELMFDRFSGDAPATSRIVAVGTPTQPIVFTSAEDNPVAGSWIGISFNMVPDPMNKIQYARVEYAGGLTGTGSSTCNIEPPVPDAAIRIRGVVPTQFVTDTTILNSAAHGIDRGWQSDTQPDFMATNTFTNVAACKQTTPRPATAACPDPVPCPK